MNNKGITLVEIIISVALISIVLLFLFMLLVTVNGINQESEINSTYLINKSLILKNIEEDLLKTKSIQISDCDKEGVNGIRALYSSYGVGVDYFQDKDDNYNVKYEANVCMMLTYTSKDDTVDTNPAYLGIYYYKSKDSYVISYIHGDVKATRLLPEFEKYNVNADGTMKHNITINRLSGSITYDGSLINLAQGDGFSTINIPIIGSDEKDYSILISYYS